MSDTLHDTLDALLRSGTTSNPALNKLLDDYTRSKLVLVVVGGLFLLGFVGLTVFSWRRFRTASTTDRKWTFEKRTYLSFAALGALVSALAAVVIAANISNAIDPRTGFTGSLGMIPNAPPGSQTGRLHQAFTAWLQTSNTNTPTLVRHAIDDRLAWQQPKAIICTVLLGTFVWLSVRIWHTRIEKSRAHESRRYPRSGALRLAGWGSVTACLLLTLMVMGNTQASFAPLGLTLFYG